MHREIPPGEFPKVVAFINEIAGIVLQDTKAYLIESRLGPLLDSEKISSYDELIRVAERDRTNRLANRIIDAITTNETSFFRDRRPFDLLVHKLVPDVIERQAAVGSTLNPRIDIWSAGSSTGQEVYSIAISLKELLFDLTQYRVRLLGTDISESVLATAARGRYTEHEISRGLTQERIDRHFNTIANKWQIDDELRALVTFKQLNLMKNFRLVGVYDIIFCRNVAIYFSIENRRSLFDRLADRLRPRGVLVLGATESMNGVSKRFVRSEFHGSIFYEKTK